jgi:lipopolysaccharide export system protein LptA
MIARIFLILLIVSAISLPATAQTRSAPRDTGTPNAMQGFSKNKGQPVNIEAEQLEVRDKDKTAVFSGKVVVTQGDTTMKCKTLTVYYVGQVGKGDDAKPAVKGPDGAEQKIKKLEAHGDVVVTQADQIATGDNAVFDMDTNIVTMGGKVVLTQGQNVLRGNKLVVDMTNGYSRVESSGGGGGRVQGLFVPSGGSPTAPGNNKPPSR